MAALDGSIVNVALPRIGHELRVDTEAAQWVVNAYLLVISSLLLVFGRVGDSFGYGRILGIGFAIFGAASATCGTARSFLFLVASRAVQGVGASMLMAAGPALVTTSFPAQERGRALGLTATATYLGLALGPSLGGWITERFGWHWVFLVNLPVSVGGILLVFLALKPAPGKGSLKLDVGGALLFAAGLTALLFAFFRASHAGVKEPVVDVAALAGLFLLAGFVWRESKARDPLVPLKLFESGAFSGGVGAAWLQYMVVFMLMFLLPFFLEGPRRLSPARTGELLTAQPLVMVLVTGAAGWLSDKIGTRGPSTAGMVVLGLGGWLVSRLGAESSLLQIAGSLAVVGLGVGLFTSPNNSAIMGAAPRDRQGVASGLLAASRNVGMASGVSVAALLHAAWKSFDRTFLVAAGLALVGAALCLFRPRPAEA